MARQPLVVFANQPRQRTRRRTSSFRRYFRRRAGRAANAATNPDNLLRGMAMLQGAAIAADPMVARVMAAYNGGQRNGLTLFSEGVIGLRLTPASTYFKALLPSVAAEAGIGTRKVVKKGISKFFGFMK